MLYKLPQHSQHIEPVYRTLIFIFSFLAIILILVILYFALSSAIVIIEPDFKTQNVGFAVQVTSASPAPDGRVFGEVAETALSKTKQFEVKGTDITDGKASGEVILFNTSGRDQTLIATTRLLTPDQKLYRLDDTVVVPGQSQITAVATADQAGAEYVAGESKLTIPGLAPSRQTEVYGQTKGFSQKNRTVYALTQEMFSQAKAELTNELKTEAETELKKQFKNPEKLLAKSLVSQMVSEKTDAKVGKDQKQFSITLAVKIKGLAADEAVLKNLATANLKDIYPLEQNLLKIDSNSFNYQITYLEPNSEQLIAQAKGEYSLNVANVQINKAELTGMAKKEALKNLNNLSGVKNAWIILPFWTKYLPALSDKISIQIK